MISRCLERRTRWTRLRRMLPEVAATFGPGCWLLDNSTSGAGRRRGWPALPGRGSILPLRFGHVLQAFASSHRTSARSRSGSRKYSLPTSLPNTTTDRGTIRTSSRTGVPCRRVQGSQQILGRFELQGQVSHGPVLLAWPISGVNQICFFGRNWPLPNRATAGRSAADSSGWIRRLPARLAGSAWVQRPGSMPSARRPCWHRRPLSRTPARPSD